MIYIIYGNGGSGNHGCEAIVRGTYAILRGEMRILSASVEEDRTYGLDKLAVLSPSVTGETVGIEWLRAYARLKLKQDYGAMDGIAYLPAIRSEAGKADVALSAGGDNYCYANQDFYGYLNKAYKKHGFETVLWGCSVEPSIVQQTSVGKDLKNYSLIVARESLSYNALKQVCNNTIMAPDPAFFMPAEVCKLPSIFAKATVIGINASPMIISNEKKKGVTYQNYLELMRYLLRETDYNIALIPHVVWPKNDDRKVLKKLYEDINCTERIAVIEDHTAPELKYIISQCDAFIGARTHATIAAYSSAVPTFVVGYSVKARGIAKDLFGKTDGYVIPVQELTDSDQLIYCMRHILDEGDSIKAHLTNFLPKYKEPMTQAVREVEQIAGVL